jgi:Fe-S-cluster-containing hydrogenase component 2
MKAIEIIDEKPAIKIERCIGCGLCSTGCPHDAIRMQRAVDIPAPPANNMDFGLRILQGKGKLERFIEVNKVKSSA